MSDPNTNEINEEGKKLFIICPIGDPSSEDRKRSDQVKKYIIDPIAEEMGYTTIRADGISQPGTITNQIVERLLNDKLVVADLTGHNPNVLYELAVRHAIGEPVILMISHGQKIPFDVLAQRVIFYDHTNLDIVDEAKQELRRQISAVESEEFIVDSPIKTRIPLENIQRSTYDKVEMQEIIAIRRNHSEQLDRINTMFTNISPSMALETNPILATYRAEIQELKRQLHYAKIGQYRAETDSDQLLSALKAIQERSTEE